jgi:hypothetical protein
MKSSRVSRLGSHAVHTWISCGARSGGVGSKGSRLIDGECGRCERGLHGRPPRSHARYLQPQSEVERSELGIGARESRDGGGQRTTVQRVQRLPVANLVVPYYRCSPPFRSVHSDAVKS